MYPGPVSSYPVDVQYPRQEAANKLFAVPVLGYLVKTVMLIPHLIVLAILQMVVAVLQYVLWIPVIVLGRYPNWGHLIVGGTLSWHNRVVAYYFGLEETYPAFSLADPGTGREAQMLFQPAPTSSRLYAFPLVGYAIKMVVLIPHMIALYVLTLLAMLAILVTWIPVLLTGRYPDWGYTLVGGWNRYFTRYYAYWYGLTDAYPPFRLSS
jgi:hypothetical protein